VGKTSKTGQSHPRLDKWPRSDVWQEAQLEDDAARKESEITVPIAVRLMLQNTPPVGRELVNQRRG
jgi:hypothetical protein